jgi:hypothetical protein
MLESELLIEISDLIDVVASSNRGGPKRNTGILHCVQDDGVIKQADDDAGLRQAE